VHVEIDAMRPGLMGTVIQVARNAPERETDHMHFDPLAQTDAQPDRPRLECTPVPLR